MCHHKFRRSEDREEQWIKTQSTARLTCTCRLNPARGGQPIKAAQTSLNNRSYRASNRTFEHTKEFIQELSAILPRALRHFAGPTLGRKN